MQCPQCDDGDIRLLRYQNGLDIWGCRQCDYQSALLDCPSCERRLVRRIGVNSLVAEVWACYHCCEPKLKCQGCGRGWLVADAGGCGCDQCGQRWPNIDKAGGVASV
ncbi:hypothetical protein SIN8267_02728 [Sinobacterium norvegicum]|uniref:Uncharacterized protein n=1 Tax=Sinobacterium norvegicum TaxID=1641715 RepID=A0ABN8EN16_9GAMM|nr:hypothetical protein [Sinobacterium norvegicum]CAH0992595.1 hypothetical protein SIN8267_02728 [Sinobacterium norvegicum]